MTVKRMLKKAKANNEWKVIICNNETIKAFPNPTANNIITKKVYEYQGCKLNVPAKLLNKTIVESVCNMYSKVAVIKVKM